MSLKHYYYLVIAGAIVSWALFFTVFYNFTPEVGLIIVILFYTTLFLSSLTTLFLLNFTLRLINFYKKNKVVGREINKAFQQSLFLSLIGLICLILEAGDLLRWWNAAILLFIFLFIQYILRFSRNYK